MNSGKSEHAVLFAKQLTVRTESVTLASLDSRNHPAQDCPHCAAYNVLPTQDCQRCTAHTGLPALGPEAPSFRCGDCRSHRIAPDGPRQGLVSLPVEPACSCRQFVLVVLPSLTHLMTEAPPVANQDAMPPDPAGNGNAAEGTALVAELSKRIIGNVEHAIVGKRKQLVLSLVAWLSGGHVLLEDVPGVAKTMLARALASSVGCDFKRVQCTPDLLPSDVTGTSIFNQKQSEFEFRPGPVFTQILLADEINRATPRTQASLLEAMAEGRVTVDGTTHDLKPPFLVIATQNPVDHEGTFPLPEAQLDRFLMRFSLGYPNLEEEMQMLEMLQHQHPIDRLQPVATAQQLIAGQQAIKHIHVAPSVRQYMLEFIQQTRQHSDLALGGSPRASIALFRCGQAMAAIRGRNFVAPDDIKRILPAVMNHRVILRPESRLRKITADTILQDIISEIAVPTV